MYQCVDCGAPCGTRYKKNQNGGYVCEKCYHESNKAVTTIALIVIGLIVSCVVGATITLPFLSVISPVVDKVGYNIASIAVLSLGAIFLIGTIVMGFARKKKHGFKRFFLLLLMFVMFSIALFLLTSCFYQDGMILKTAWGMDTEQHIEGAQK